MRKKERFMRKQLEVSRRLSTTELQLRVDYPDEDLRRRISSFLGSRHFPAFRRLEVSVLAGAVTVRGQVGSYYEKQVALDTCRRVAGVLCTIDQVEVEAGDGAAAPGPDTNPRAHHGPPRSGIERRSVRACLLPVFQPLFQRYCRSELAGRWRSSSLKRTCSAESSVCRLLVSAVA